MQANNKKLILVTGATGYVGSHLIQFLKTSGYQIRCLVRRPEKLSGFQDDDTEIVCGDVLQPSSIHSALMGVHTAFYLIHSMADQGNFEETDRVAAQRFVSAAKESGIKRIIYLGGLGADNNLSTHLRSRQEVGRIFRESGILSIEFRASIIIGNRSISFEMIRALVEKLPIMITPRWVRAEAQPIAIQDVLDYLIQAIEIPLTESKIFEIGGPDRLSYRQIMKEYARQRGLKRIMIPVPILTPHLSSLWLRFITPLYVRIGRRLIESIKNSTVVHNKSALQYFSTRPCTLEDAIKQALDEEEREFLKFRAINARKQNLSKPEVQSQILQGSRIYDIYSTHLQCSSESAFEPIRHIGGKNGWYYANWLWFLRKVIDHLLGGAGFRKSHRDPDNLKSGDTINFWRVEIYEPNQLLRLRAEMKLPGRAWLQFEVYPYEKGIVLFQTAIFQPYGLMGRIYWCLLYPIHKILFRGMLRNINLRQVID